MIEALSDDAALLDGKVVLRRAGPPGIEWVEVGDEIVVWHRDSESFHLLNYIASVFFHLADGETDLSAIVDRMARASGQPPHVVDAPVRACAAQLHGLMLLNIVA